MRPCINSASAHLPWQPLIRKYNRGLGVKSNRNIWNKSIRPQGFWKQICKYLHLRRILSYHLHPRVTSYGRDDISVFAKLHNFLISERLLMYLLSSLSAGCWDIKCITLYFYCRAPFLLPLRIAVRENRSRNPYFVPKEEENQWHQFFGWKYQKGHLPNSAMRWAPCLQSLYASTHSVEKP